MAEGHESYKSWQANPLTKERWSDDADAKCFILDLLSPILGITILINLCIYMKMDPPRPPSKPKETPNALEVCSKKSSSKRSKITAEDAKGHRALTSFFKVKSKN